MQNPLANLADISTGPEISYWPLAWGWWLVIAVGLLLLALIIWQSYAFWQRRALQRRALKAIKQIDPGKQDAAAELHAILRATCMHAFTQVNIASLHSKQWYLFLKQKVDDESLVQPIHELEQNLYTKNAGQLTDIQINAVNTWIKKALPPKRGDNV